MSIAGCRVSMARCWVSMAGGDRVSMAGWYKVSMAGDDRAPGRV